MFSYRLKQLRENLGLTQVDLAKMLNVTQSTIAYYEKGRKMPTLENAKILAEILSTSLDYLCSTSDEEYIIDKDTTSLFSDKILKDINNLSPKSQKDLEDFIFFLKFRDSQMENDEE